MPKRFRLTRRFNAAMTEDGYRRLRRFADAAGLDEGEAMSFVFEHFDSITDEEALTHRTGCGSSTRNWRRESDDIRRAPLSTPAHLADCGSLRREFIWQDEDRIAVRRHTIHHTIHSVDRPDRQAERGPDDGASPCTPRNSPVRDASQDCPD